ncbi:MAG: hypothetical protein LH609_13940 [Rudanella sp.]|nr:hypothetical protein [Rudanella sp.]
MSDSRKVAASYVHDKSTTSLPDLRTVPTRRIADDQKRLSPWVNRGQQGQCMRECSRCSSDGSLRTMLLFAAIGMPLVAIYTLFLFWIFRAK